MTQQGKDIRATLGYKVDQNSVAAASQANKNVAASYADIDSAVRALGADVLRLNPQLATQTSQVNQQATAVDKLANNYRKVATEASNALRFARADNTVGSGYGTVRSIGGAFGQLANQSALGQSVSAIAGLGVELGAIGLVAGAAAVGVRALTSEVEKQTKAQSARLDAEREGARELADLTTQEIRDRLEAAQERLRIDQEVSRRQTANSLLYNLTIIDQPLKFGAALAGLDPTYNAYQDALIKNQLALESGSAFIDIYTAALNENTGALNSAAEAALAQADRALEFDRKTREEREKEIAQIERDIAVLQAQALEAGKGTDAFKELTAQIEELKLEGAQLLAVQESYADALEAEKDAKQALIDSSKAIQDGIEEQQAAEEKLRDATEKVTEAQGDLAEALTEHLENQKRIADEQRESEAKALADRNEDEQEAREKAHESLEEQETKHRKRIQEIHDRFATDELTAIGTRDALALYNAKLRRDEDLKRENEDNDEREKAIQKSLDDQLKVIQNRYDDQLKTVKEAATKAINAENERYRKQQQNLESALNKAIAAEQFANNRLEALRSLNAFRAEYWAGVVEVADKRLADAHAALAVSVAQSALLVETVNAQVSGNRVTNGQSGNALVGGFNAGGGLGASVNSASLGNLNLTGGAPRTGAGAFPSGGRAALPSVYGGSRSVVLNFAPVINAANMNDKQFQRMADGWFRTLRPIVRA